VIVRRQFRRILGTEKVQAMHAVHETKGRLLGLDANRLLLPIAAVWLLVFLAILMWAWRIVFA